MIEFTDRCKQLFIEAEQHAKVTKNLYIYPEHVAYSIFSNPSYIINKILNEFDLDNKSIISAIESKLIKLPIIKSEIKEIKIPANKI